MAVDLWATLGPTEAPALSVIARKLMALSPQNASIERLCKAHSQIHTVLRNIFSLSTHEKLVYIYVNSRLLGEEEFGEEDEYACDDYF